MNQPELPGDINKIKFTPPTMEQAMAEAQRIQLPESECIAFMSYFRSNGWKVGRVPMKSWRDALLTWRQRWLRSQQPKREPSLYDMKVILDAKTRLMDALKRKNTIVTAWGSKWVSPQARDEYLQLKQSADELTRKIASML